MYVRIPSIDASSYALGYSFRTPLPVKEVFGETVDDDEEESKDQTEQGEQGTDLLITTRVAGKLKQLEKEVADPNTDATYIVCILFLRWKAMLIVRSNYRVSWSRRTSTLELRWFMSLAMLPVQRAS